MTWRVICTRPYLPDLSVPAEGGGGGGGDGGEGGGRGGGGGAGVGRFGVGAHTDSGYLSLLLQDSTGGLQVQNGAGQGGSLITSSRPTLNLLPFQGASVCAIHTFGTRRLCSDLGQVLVLNDLTAGEWVDAPPVPGTMVVNLGEMLQLCTGGYYLATPHRVVSKPGRGGLDNAALDQRPISSPSARLHEHSPPRW